MSETVDDAAREFVDEYFTRLQRRAFEDCFKAGVAWRDVQLEKGCLPSHSEILPLGVEPISQGGVREIS